jgi:hypothetical protein
VCISKIEVSVKAFFWLSLWVKGMDDRVRLEEHGIMKNGEAERSQARWQEENNPASECLHRLLLPDHRVRAEKRFSLFSAIERKRGKDSKYRAPRPAPSLNDAIFVRIGNLGYIKNTQAMG